MVWLRFFLQVLEEIGILHNFLVSYRYFQTTNAARIVEILCHVECSFFRVLHFDGLDVLQDLQTETELLV